MGRLDAAVLRAEPPGSETEPRYRGAGRTECDVLSDLL